MNRTVNQSNRFHALLTQRKFDKEDKTELVKLYTDGRETSSTRMTMDEMAQAIKHLEGEVDGAMNKMKAKIINVYRDIIDYPNPLKLEQSHWDGLNKHLLRTCKKPLHKLDYEALRIAVTSMEKWRDTNVMNAVGGILGEERKRVGRPRKQPI